MTDLNEKPTLTFDQIAADLMGLGIEELVEPIVVQASGKTVEIYLSNTPTEDELETLLAVEELKGPAWIASVKCEVLARSISRINGVDIKALRGEIVVDPITGEERQMLVVLRDMIRSWGQEVRNVLWKVLMVHCQRIEDRLFQSLPESHIMTDVEKRFLQQAMEEIQEAQNQVYKDAAKELILGDEES